MCWGPASALAGRKLFTNSLHAEAAANSPLPVNRGIFFVLRALSTSAVAAVAVPAQVLAAALLDDVLLLRY